MKVLVVYFSRTGNTRQIAQAMTGPLAADLECVQDGGAHSGIWGYVRSSYEAIRERVITIGAPIRDPSDYDLIILGTPVWAHNMCSPIRSYIAARKERFRAIAVFCTQGGSGASKVIGDIGKLCGRAPLASLVLDDQEIKKGQFTDKLTTFIKSVTLAQAA